MHMVAPARVWRVEDVLALPWDGRRLELIDGLLFVNGVEVPGGDLAHLDPAMTPSASLVHQRAVVKLVRLLADYVEPARAGLVIVAPADVRLAPETVVQPDVFVAPFVGGRAPRSLVEIRTLLLAVEVLSPSTTRTDRVHKRALYQRAGVAEYWIVDLDARVVERWKPDSDVGEILTTTLEWLAVGAESALRIELAAFFSGVVE